jgi:hypothetical protein
MSLLTVVQNASLALGLSSPSTVVGNTSQQQMLALANQGGKDLVTRGKWRALMRRNSFTLSTSAVDQGAVNGTIVTASDFSYMLGDTFWNLTLDQPINGPLDEFEEELEAATAVSGPYQRWANRGGRLLIYPQPTAADSASFMYISKAFCQASGGTKQLAWAADTDTGVLDEQLLELDLIWRWKRANGLDYAEEFNTCEARIAAALAYEAAGKRISLEGRPRSSHGLIVPIGSWNL